MDLNTRQGRREQGLRIQQAVERAGFSIEELAVRIGCSRALIYQYLSGSTLAQPDRLQQIAAICEISLSSFYDESASVPVEPAASKLSEVVAPITQDTLARQNEILNNLQILADAQESPADFKALADTSNRIIQLAGQLGDKSALTKAQMRLGNALLRIADYPRASEALQFAVAAAAESGDIQSETSARQGLGSALVSMGRAEEARAQFAHIAAGPVFRGRWQGTISLGGIHEMLGEYQSAMARFDEAAAMLDEAAATGQTSAQEIASGLIYVNTNRRNVYMDGGDFDAARLLAVKGMGDAEAIGNADQHLEARFDLAWCDFNCARWSDAYHGFTSMLQLARFVNDQGRETLALAWLGILTAAAGDFASAITYGKNALTIALQHGDRRGELYAQLALADAYIGQGDRQSEARYHTNQALAVTISLRQERGEIECRLRLARLAAQTKDLSALREAAERSLQSALLLGSRHLECLARCWRCAAISIDPESGNDQISEALTELNTALVLSQEMYFSEGIWRANYLLGSMVIRQTPKNFDRAREYFSASINQLEILRSQLITAMLPDTLLENWDALQVYREIIEVMQQVDRKEADKIIEAAAWPPLELLSSRGDEAANSD